MEIIPLFRSGEPVTKIRDKLNLMVMEIRRLRNIQGAGIIVSHNSNGVLLAIPQRNLTVDDKYVLDSDYNESTMVQRLGDLMRGDLGDLWRIRAVPGGAVRTIGERRSLPGFRLMWLINHDGLAGAEGGWLTDSADVGLSETEHSPDFAIPTPIRRVAQIGDIVILTDDDISSTTEDGDGYTYANIRQDAHFHMSEERDGRIYFTKNPPGDLPSGYDIKGEMVGDPAVANDPLSLLGRESVEWRPQIKVPIMDIPGTIYDPRDTTNWRFPPIIRIPSSSLEAYDFGYLGTDEGWSGHWQPMFKLDSYGLGWQVKFSAENTEEEDRDIYITVIWKLANDGEDISTAGLTTSNFTITVPAGATEQDLQIEYLAMVPASQYDEKDLLICDVWGREASNVLDTLDSRMLVIDLKLIYMTVPEPPT
jgi:hypothetical protein